MRRVDFLLVTRNFPPLVGGMEKLNRHLLRALVARGSAALCGPAGSEPSAGDATHVSTAPVSPLWAFLVRNWIQAVYRAVRSRPRWLLAGSGLTAPAAWCAARLTGARVAVYVHGLDLLVPHPVYQRVWLPFLRRCDLVIANSSNTRAIALGRGVEEARLRVLLPGAAAPGLAELSADDALVLEKPGPLLLSVGRLTRRKGLAEFVRNALPELARRFPDVSLAIVGEDARDALHSQGGGRAAIEQAARESGMLDRLLFLGRVGDAQLTQLYRQADCHVFPVVPVGGDVEGFGMVAIEAAAHGLPTVAFDEGGIADAVSEGRSGHLVPAGDYPAMVDAIETVLARGETARRAAAASSREFAAGFAWEKFGERLHGLLDAPP